MPSLGNEKSEARLTESVTLMKQVEARWAANVGPRLMTAALFCALAPLAAQAKPQTPAPVPGSAAPKPNSSATGPVSKMPARVAVAKPGAAGAPAAAPAGAPAGAPAAAPAAAEPVEVPELVLFAGTVSGVIEDSVGNPIVGAEIYVTNLPHQTRSGAGGTFRLPGLPSGPLMITARQIGFHPSTVTVHVRSGQSHDLDLTLAVVQARSIELPPVTVIASQTPRRSVFQAGFFLRKATHPGGTFFDREYILAMNPMYLSDVFRTTNGMQAVRDRRGQSQWMTRVNSTSACPVRFFIDGNGVPLNGMSIDDLVRPSEVEGIEIYRGVSTVPAEFSGKSVQDDSRCGVVAIWTRVTR